MVIEVRVLVDLLFTGLFTTRALFTGGHYSYKLLKLSACFHSLAPIKGFIPTPDTVQIFNPTHIWAQLDFSHRVNVLVFDGKK